MRVDSGVREGSVIGGQFDSMLAKLIVWGQDRETALQRARRALSEYTVEGLPTVIPFHQAIVSDPAFTAENGSFDVYTKWIEEEWWASCLRTSTQMLQLRTMQTQPRSSWLRSLAAALRLRCRPTSSSAAVLRARSPRSVAVAAPAAASGDAVVAPMQGTVIKVNVEEGQEVAEGDVVLILEAMKMENPVKAHKSGTVTGLAVEQGAQINKGAPLLEIK